MEETGKRKEKGKKQRIKKPKLKGRDDKKNKLSPGPTNEAASIR